MRNVFKQTSRYVIALNFLATILFGALTVTLYYRGNELQTRIVELEIQNGRLQNLIYNYTPTLFMYPQYELVADLSTYSRPNGILKLFVVIVTPHNGYAFVNQTAFVLSPDPEMTLPFLDPNMLKQNSVKMYRELIFAVPAGSFQTILEVPFWCDVQLAWQWRQPGSGGDFPLGIVGISLTFYDAQTNGVYVRSVTARVRAVFDNPMPQR